MYCAFEWLVYGDSIIFVTGSFNLFWYERTFSFVIFPFISKKEKYPSYEPNANFCDSLRYFTKVIGPVLTTSTTIVYAAILLGDSLRVLLFLLVLSVFYLIATVGWSSLIWFSPQANTSSEYKSDTVPFSRPTALSSFYPCSNTVVQVAAS